MLKRVALFVTWGAIGTVLTYGALYLFTPFGLAIVVPAVLIARVLPKIGGDRLPEALGLLAGPGLFCLLVAASGVDDAGSFTAAGVVLVGAAVLAYGLMGRARCARGA